MWNRQGFLDKQESSNNDLCQQRCFSGAPRVPSALSTHVPLLSRSSLSQFPHPFRSWKNVATLPTSHLVRGSSTSILIPPPPGSLETFPNDAIDTLREAKPSILSHPVIHPVTLPLLIPFPYPRPQSSPLPSSIQAQRLLMPAAPQQQKSDKSEYARTPRTTSRPTPTLEIQPERRCSSRESAWWISGALYRYIGGYGGWGM